MESDVFLQNLRPVAIATFSLHLSERVSQAGSQAIENSHSVAICRKRFGLFSGHD